MSALTSSAIIAHCREQLPGYKCPKHVLFVESLPKNSVGKVQKVELVHRYGAPDDPAPRPSGSEGGRG